MKDLDKLSFHPMSERIVDILCKKTQNDNPEFFRVLLCYYLAKVTASMRVKIATKDRGEIPVNLYAVNLASSGHGKGHSTNIIEEQLLYMFKDVFESETCPIIFERSLAKITLRRANIQNIDEEIMFEKVKSEFNDLGKLAFSFDSGTPAAIKQMRHKLLMGNIGAINWEMDEVGSNLTGNLDLMGTFLEMFDVGKIKQKLTKNTKENTRNEEIDGRTPANMLIFGTPSKLFDGAKVENEFYAWLESGGARRCIYGFSKKNKKNKTLTPEKIYDILTDTNTNIFMKEVATSLGKLADITNHNKVITVSKDVSILAIEYKLVCETKAEEFGEHQDIAKAELSHRYFKALKLAGIYAFIDGDSEITENNFYHAMCMTEDSGKAFEKILSRDRTHVKLAKYLGSIGHEVTHVELTEDLPFYRGSTAAKQELIQYASAWGHKHHIIIKRALVSGIEFLSGDTLHKTDLKHLLLSYSNDISDGYQNVQTPWNQLYKLTQQPMKHWINHHSVNGHRDEDSLIPGFDMIVIDIDSGTTVKEVQLLMQEYKYLLHTTKRHTNQNHRFRMIFPLNYHLKLTRSDYRKFIKNIYEWLPFEVDVQTSDRSRKWLTHPGQFNYSAGKSLIDARLFIPQTTKNDERTTFINTYQSMTNMERWFLNGSNTGNRNNQLTRYAFLLLDLGYTHNVIRKQVILMNDKLKDKLNVAEIDKTIMVSIVKKQTKKII